VILDEAEALLDPVSDIEGFMLACLVDASTGMVLASRKDQDDISLPRAAAGGGGRMVMRTRRPGGCAGLPRPAARECSRSPAAATDPSISGTARSPLRNRPGLPAGPA
jgi:hypothetical protein